MIANSPCAAEGFARVLSWVDSQMLRSLTYDQEGKMTAHEQFSQKTGMTLYFAHPHSPWGRGINENTKELLRDCLPEGADLRIYRKDDLDTIAWTLKVRRGESLGWKCPAELSLPEGAFDFQAFWSTPPKPTALGT